MTIIMINIAINKGTATPNPIVIFCISSTKGNKYQCKSILLQFLHNYYIRI